MSAIATADPLLSVEKLHVRASDGRTLVCDAGFTVAAGQAIAIVGESGSGKSLTARSVVGLLPSGLDVSGSIRYRGREVLGNSRVQGELRGAEVCMILQDPFTSLHPMMTCGAIIAENMTGANNKRLSRGERRIQAVKRLAEVGIRDPSVVDRRPYELSGGMRQRVAIAAALAQNPRLLIADEPSTALDATTQREVLELLGELQRSRGMALILITHDLGVAFSVCQEVTVFYAGSVAEVGPVAQVAAAPAHPYTLGLLLSDPPADRRVEQLFNIPGTVPAPDTVAGRCSFSPRCQYVAEQCLAGKPTLETYSPTRRVACVRAVEIAPELKEVQSSFSISEMALDGATGDQDTKILEVRALEVAYGHRHDRSGILAVDGVSLDIQSGESVGIVGESGCGKTTLSRAIVGLTAATGGSITIAGVDATSYSALGRRGRHDVRRRVQIVFQDPYSSLNPVHTVASALSDALRLRMGADAKPAHVDALLERVGLPAAYRTRTPQALSGGERQRIAIARALAVQPSLIILDEPVSALDVSVQAQILTLLRELRSELGLAYLFITHDLAVVRQIADRIYVMNKGKIVEYGLTRAILDDPRDDYTRSLVRSRPCGLHSHGKERQPQ